MIEVVFHGNQVKTIDTIVMDFNGTLAKDGMLIQGIAEKLSTLSKCVQLVVLTGDTYGTVKHQMENLEVETITFIKGDAGQQKLNYVLQKNPQQTAVIGNGFNDVLMMETSGLSVAVVGAEGCYGKLLCMADIVVSDIHHALDLFIHPTRIKATLNR